MPEFISRLQQKAAELWKVLDKSQKRRIYIISAILVTVLAASIVLATRTSYVPLIKSSNQKDISEMTKILQEQNIKFKLDQNSGTILINSKDNNKAQVALIQGGYPKSGMTFEDAFSSIKINTTESDKQKLWQHYDESTLSTKLKMLADNIEDASVTISKPEDTPFIIDKKDNEKPSANVIIKPKSELTEKQVQGIVMMVASSVIGLEPKDVTVLDNNLNILNNQSVDSTINEANNQYDMKQKMKVTLENSVYNLYNKVPLDSFESIRAVVNPVLDFDKLKRQTSDISNGTGLDGPAIISSERTKEKLVNGEAGGVPGTDTNPGDTTTYPLNSDGNSTYDKSSEKINNEYKRTVTDEEKALGALNMEKSSMTVALYYGRRVKDDKNITAEFIESIKSDVSRATGIPAANISVNKYKMAPETIEVKSLADTIKELVNAYGFFALLLLLTIGLMIALIPRKKKKEAPQEAAPAAEPALAAATTGGFDVTVGDEFEDEIQEIDMEEKSEVKKQIEKFVKQKPDSVAQLLRTWLSDDWE
ncbi:MAG TPA: flagellar basal-body MS-ring/collar protein FliF [Pseudobacteroides sp.]|uniref:flagellar basal-body MS-ring/collar protein FliF n=1 Tax=Pseudobacteroides sp. TaxID=1968840 RepID=UPI002F92495D